MALSNQSPDPDKTRRPTRTMIARTSAVIGSVGIVVAVAATGSLALAVLDTDGGPVHVMQTADQLERVAAPQTDDEYTACLREAAGSPDTLEHRVDECRSRGATPTEIYYLACMHSVGRAPDTLERWAARCVEVATAVARYNECLREVGGTPDALERWADTCRQRVMQ